MDKLITNQVLIGTMAAESLVLFTQTILEYQPDMDAYRFSCLEIGAINSLYVIRERSGNLTNQEKDNETNDITKAKHKELYYYDYHISNLFKNFVSNQSPAWLNSYKQYKQQMAEFITANINSEPNI
jgi:hypothetical protein